MFLSASVIFWLFVLFLFISLFVSLKTKGKLFSGTENNSKLLNDRYDFKVLVAQAETKYVVSQEKISLAYVNLNCFSSLVM